jgi:glutathione peroxidase
MQANIYQFNVEDIHNNQISLEKYKNQIVLIVNTASKCGFNSQLKDLEKLYLKYKEYGFIVLAFPCDQFLNQEFLNSKEILDFCQINFKISFPIFAKINVNGNHASQLYQYLKHQCRGILGTKTIKWNFTKFLINRQGEAVKRFSSITNTNIIEKEIKKYL